MNSGGRGGGRGRGGGGKRGGCPPWKRGGRGGNWRGRGGSNSQNILAPPSQTFRRSDYDDNDTEGQLTQAPQSHGVGLGNNIGKLIQSQLAFSRLQGQYINLWLEAEASQTKWKRRQLRQNTNSSQLSFNAKRAEAKGRSGQYRNALQALSSEGLADDSDEVLQSLRQKHPQGPVPILPDTPCPDPIPIPSDLVRSAVLSFNADTAPGPSGFRANYFKDLFSSPNPNQWQRYFSSLSNLVNSMNKGKIPRPTQPFLFAATLHAAEKSKAESDPFPLATFIPVLLLNALLPFFPRTVFRLLVLFG